MNPGNAAMKRLLRMPFVLGLLGAVAVGSVGFAVGDVSTAPDAVAATTTDKAGHEDRDFAGAWDIAPGHRLEIKGVNGAIDVDRASGSKTSVDAVKTARHSDPDEVKIEVIPENGNITICAVYPAGWLGKENTCAPGESEHTNTRNNDVQVHFTVHLARGVELMAHTVNGEIRAEGLESPVEARTVNGSVHVSTTRTLTATTVNGSVTAKMGELDKDGMEVKTVNGTVTLEMPESVDADLDCSTVNGDIDTDLPIRVEGRISRHHLRGTIGKGGPALRAETVNGTIKLKTKSSI